MAHTNPHRSHFSQEMLGAIGQVLYKKSEDETQSRNRTIRIERERKNLSLLSGLPDFSLFGFAQGLAPSMLRASDF